MIAPILIGLLRMELSQANAPQCGVRHSTDKNTNVGGVLSQKCRPSNAFDKGGVRFGVMRGHMFVKAVDLNQCHYGVVMHDAAHSFYERVCASDDQ
jgi:hypothetical protein